MLRALTQAGRGLAAAHAAGLIHRDFKPGNVIMGHDGHARVTDFGLARAADALPGGAVQTTSGQLGTLTVTGSVLGTPAYMAPEQYTCEPVDARSDQFSFCVTLYEALYGERPFAGETLDELKANVLDGRVRPEPDDADVPGHVRRALLRGLSVKPDDRHASIEALLAELSRDPGVRRRISIAVGGSVAVLGVGIALAVATGGRPGMCSDAEHELAGVWDRDVRAQVRTAFAMTSVEHAGETFDRFSKVVDDYAAGWRALYEESCRATRVAGTQTVEDMHLRTTCLQGRRASLAALTSAFAEADARAIDRAVEAAHALPALDDCRDVDALRRGVQPPDDPDVHAEVTLLRSQLEEADSLEDADRTQEAIVLAESVLARARQLGYGPLIAEALVRLGDLYRQDVRVSDAERVLHEAELLAEELGYDDVRVRALVGMTRLLSSSSSRFDEARRYGRRALAALRRGGTDAPRMRARVKWSLATVLLQEQKVDESLALLREAHDEYVLSPHRDPAFETSLLSEIADVQLVRGEYEAARATNARALAIADEELGPLHPDSIRRAEGLAIVLRMLGAYEEARALDQRALAFWSSPDGKRRAEAMHSSVSMVTFGTRSARVRVVDGAGQPVAGADVVAAHQMQADGKYLAAWWGIGAQSLLGVRYGVTGADGVAVIEKVVDGTVTFVAEHDATGRSWVVQVDQDADVLEVELPLRPWGSLRGRATRGQQTEPGMLVVAAPAPATTRPAMVAVAAVQSDGSFEFPRLAAGDYELFTTAGMGVWQQAIDVRSATVAAGEPTTIELDMASGTVELSVRVRDLDGEPLVASQVLLFEGEVVATTAADLERTVPKTSNMRSTFANGDADAVFASIVPGRYTACVVPLDGDYRNPEYGLRFLDAEYVGALPTHCHPVTVEPEPGEQTMSVNVPAARLPEPPPRRRPAKLP